MATSTEESVREVLVGALRGIAVSDLGFDDSEGNVKDYLFEYEPEESRWDYLGAKVSGEQVIRVWSVEVISTDNFYEANNITERQYAITTEAHYELGVNGEGIKTLIEHFRKVRLAYRALYTHLGHTVDLVVSAEAPSFRVIDAGLDSGPVVQASMTMTATKVNPDW